LLTSKNIIYILTFNLLLILLINLHIAEAMGLLILPNKYGKGILKFQLI